MIQRIVHTLEKNIICFEKRGFTVGQADGRSRFQNYIAKSKTKEALAKRNSWVVGDRTISKSRVRSARSEETAKAGVWPDSLRVQSLWSTPYFSFNYIENRSFIPRAFWLLFSDRKSNRKYVDHSKITSRHVKAIHSYVLYVKRNLGNQKMKKKDFRLRSSVACEGEQTIFGLPPASPARRVF